MDPIDRWLPGGEWFEYYWKKREDIMFPAPFIWHCKHKTWQLNPAFYLVLTVCVLNSEYPWPFPEYAEYLGKNNPFVLKYLKEHREVFQKTIPQVSWTQKKKRKRSVWEQDV
jgi:hypothetical protein